MRLSGRSQDISLGNSREFLERFSIIAANTNSQEKKEKTSANIVPLSFNITEFQFK